ncbi:MAG: HSP20 family protein [Verrucomicrobiales bacterium]|jgi:HSP20 family protein
MLAVRLNQTMQTKNSINSMNQNLKTWNPFRDLDELSSRLVASQRCGSSSSIQGSWTPAVDVRENENGYVVLADLPRVDKGNVTVTFSDRVLSIEGERKAEEKPEGTKVHLVERSYGSFTRSFRMPEDADGEAVKATFKDGVLTVQVPKREETKPKSIEITVD